MIWCGSWGFLSLRYPFLALDIVSGCFEAAGFRHDLAVTEEYEIRTFRFKRGVNHRMAEWH